MKKIVMVLALTIALLSCGNGSEGGEPRFVDSNNTKIRDGRYGPIADSTWSGKDNGGDTTTE